MGVTPHNILHAIRRRNHGLARIFHDLEFMEREGSGFDLLYDRLLTTGRAAPTVKEGTDSTHVTIERRVLHPGVVRLVADADERHQLSQRERIALGLLGQAESMSAAELADKTRLRRLMASCALSSLKHRGKGGIVGGNRSARSEALERAGLLGGQGVACGLGLTRRRSSPS